MLFHICPACIYIYLEEEDNVFCSCNILNMSPDRKWQQTGDLGRPPHNGFITHGVSLHIHGRKICSSNASKINAVLQSSEVNIVTDHLFRKIVNLQDGKSKLCAIWHPSHPSECEIRTACWEFWGKCEEKKIIFAPLTSAATHSFHVLVWLSHNTCWFWANNHTHTHTQNVLGWGKNQTSF